MFSVVIPCRDRIRLLEFVLCGFVNQREPPPYEIILIDSHSSEPIDALYLKYRSRLPLFLLRQPYEEMAYTISRPRNLGIRLARYGWIISLDSDCIPNQYFLNNAFNCLNDEIGMLIGERIFVRCDDFLPNGLLNEPSLLECFPKTKSISNYYRKKDRRFPRIHDGLNGPHPWAYAHGGNCIFNKTQALEIGGFDEAYDGCWGYEDIDFAYRLLSRTQRRAHYEPGLEVYHCEENVADPDPDRLRQMMEKAANRNWRRICGRIPGYESYKRRHYAEINQDIVVP